MSRVVAISQVDAFTRQPFGGNPAGVVLDAGGLSDAQMQKIAAEMNVAETAFLTPASRRDAVTGSVHASLAVWLWEAGRLRPEGEVVRFNAEQGDFLGRPGRLRVELHLAGGGPSRVRVGGGAVTVLSGTIRVE